MYKANKGCCCCHGEDGNVDIGTQSVQEVFFIVIRPFLELFTVMIWLSVIGCDVELEMMFIRCYIGNGKIAK